MGRRPEREKARRPAIISGCSGLNIKINVLKSIIIFLLPAFCLFFSAVAQQDGATLYYTIREVTVLETNARFFCEDKPIFHVDPLVMQTYRCTNLGNVLSDQSPSMVRIYGSSGSLASLSLRGTGTNHAQVSWNGFAINSPTTGQVDLSLIPAGFMQQVNVINGASGALFGSGTFGGSVNLTNKPDWDNRVGFVHSVDGGSFGSLSNLISLKVGGQRIQYQVSFIRQDAENDFRYTDHFKYGNPVIHRTHNSYYSNGLLQNLYLNLPNGNTLDAGCWYQKKSLEIPALMGNYSPSNAMQKDSAFKMYLIYRKVYEKSNLVFKTAYFTDYLRYTDKISPDDNIFSIDSRIGARRLLNEFEYRYFWSRRIIIGAGAAYNYLTGKSNNFGNPVHENEFSLSSFVKLNFNKWIGNLGLRKEFYADVDPAMMYSMGWRYTAAKILIFRTNISNKFRKPTFNEKYWKPGGNPDLKPEKGWGADAGIQGELLFKNSASSIQYAITGYFQSIDNWIQWVVLDSLTPVEYKTVHAKGIEVTWLYQYETESFRLLSTLIYNLNRSTIVSTYDANPLYAGKQLMYVPLHTAKLNLYLYWKGWMAGMNINAAGRRQTVDSNDETLRLGGYIIPDVLAGYEKKFKPMSVNVGFRVENLLNTQYEIIRAYPMPGRAFYVTITVMLNKKQTIL
jgi:vitamin B12 transporter